MRSKIEVSGYSILFVGIALLAFTFINAYLFLQEILNISVSGDLMSAFGEALAPLIATCIRAIYLGIMGWIGSIVTRRGVQILVTPRDTVPVADTRVPSEPAEVTVDENIPEATKAKPQTTDGP